MSAAPTLAAASRATQSGKPLPPPPLSRRADGPSSAVQGLSETHTAAEQVQVVVDAASKESRPSLSLEVPQAEPSRALSPMRSATRTLVAKRTEPIDTLSTCK